MAGLLSASGYLTYRFSIRTVDLAVDCKPDKVLDAAHSKGASLIIDGLQMYL